MHLGLVLVMYVALWPQAGTRACIHMLFQNEIKTAENNAGRHLGGSLNIPWHSHPMDGQLYIVLIYSQQPPVTEEGAYISPPSNLSELITGTSAGAESSAGNLSGDFLMYLG